MTRDPSSEVDGVVFRPYLLTGGRTRPAGHDIPIEALIITVGRAPTRPLTPEQAIILRTCRAPTSIAEIAALLSAPVGVARVLVSDLVTAHLVEVCETAARIDSGTVRRMIDGVRAR